MLFVEIKKLTAFNKCFKNTEVNTFITPLTFTKKSRIFICRADYINFFLLSCFWICSPPSADIRKINFGITVQQPFPQILLADFFKHSTHIIRQIRCNSTVRKFNRTSWNYRRIFRHKTIPKSEHIILDRINCFLCGFFTVRHFFSHNSESNKILDISNTSAWGFSNLCWNFGYFRCTCSNCRNHGIINSRLSYLLFQKIVRFFIQSRYRIQKNIFYIILYWNFVVNLQEILRCTSHKPVGKRLIFRWHPVKILTSLTKFKRQNLKLSRSSAIQRSFVCKHMVLNIWHWWTAENKKQLWTVFIFVN